VYSRWNESSCKALSRKNVRAVKWTIKWRFQILLRRKNVLLRHLCRCRFLLAEFWIRKKSRKMENLPKCICIRPIAPRIGWGEYSIVDFSAGCSGAGGAMVSLLKSHFYLLVDTADNMSVLGDCSVCFGTAWLNGVWRRRGEYNFIDSLVLPTQRSPSGIVKGKGKEKLYRLWRCWRLWLSHGTRFGLRLGLESTDCILYSDQF
jgi:hypothetical protein